MVDSSYIVSLLLPSATDISLYGSKAANLAKAAQLGFAVPKGLAVSRICFKDDFAHLSQDILDELHSPVAVRSSAVKEDSKTEAFAGQFESCLGIRSTSDLINAYEVVKGSGSTDTFIRNHGEAIPSEHIAVLVQHMINATRAGVVFSKDPCTGEAKAIIESNYGLGKSVVDGKVTPDSIDFLYDGTYKTFVGRKSIQINMDENSVRIQNTPIEDSQRCSLADDEIKAIADLAQQVEQKLGFAADIEWAIDSEGVLWLLQARPITTIIRE